MKGFMFIVIIMCVVLPLGSLAYIVYGLVKWNKSKKQSNEALMDIITEYKIKAEKEKEEKENKKDSDDADNNKSEEKSEEKSDNDGRKEDK